MPNEQPLPNAPEQPQPGGEPQAQQNIGPPRVIPNPRRSRAFVFTWNNYPDNYAGLLDAIPVRYIVAGEEIAPATGTPHLQGYVYFPNARTETSVRRLLPGCHIEVARGSHQQADRYCRKTRDEDEQPNEVMGNY